MTTVEAQPAPKSWLDLPEGRWLVILLGLAFLARLVIAPLFDGHPTDINNFRAWAGHMAKVGPGGFYIGPTKIWCDYPPAYPYVLWLIGLSGTSVIATKLPGILAELTTGLMLFVLARRFVRAELALLAAALYLFNPAPIYDTAVAAQMNSIIAALQLVTVWLLLKRQFGGALVLTALAILVKPQGLILLPLVLAMMVREKAWKQLVIGSVASFALAWLLAAPYVLPHGTAWNVYTWLWHQYQSQRDLYPYSSIQAFNLWSFTGMWKPDERLFLGIAHHTWGALLFGLAALGSIALIWKRRQDTALLQACALLCLAFFLFPTRMHERYLYYGVVWLTLLAVLNFRYRWPAILFSATFLINVFYELKWPTRLKPVVDFLGTGWYLPIAALNLALFAVCVWLVLRRPALETEEPTLTASADAPAAVPWVWERRDGLWMFILTVVTTVLRLWGLDHPNEMIFDEVYHARAANEYLHGIKPNEWVHPPLAKLLIAIGVYFNGMNSFGWRIVPVIAGALLVPVFYLLAKRMFGHRGWAIAATFLLCLDGVYFVQSRTAMTNIFATLFQVTALTGLYFYWLECKNNRHSPLATRLLWGTGLAISLALATRWTSLWGYGFILTWLGLREILPRREQGTGIWKVPPFDWRFWAHSIPAFIILPGVVYLLSYVPYMLQGHSVLEVITMQGDIWRYHANLRDPHPYYSAWYSWPFLVRPTWYHFHDFRNGTLSGIIALGNPAIWWASLFAAGWAVWQGFKRRFLPLFFAGTAFFFLYLPWGISPRQLNYNHYMFEAIPYAVLAITFFLKELWERNPLNLRQVLHVSGVFPLMVLFPLLAIHQMNQPPVHWGLLTGVGVWAGVWALMEIQDRRWTTVGLVVVALAVVLSGPWWPSDWQFGSMRVHSGVAMFLSWLAILTVLSDLNEQKRLRPSLAVLYLSAAFGLFVFFFPLYSGMIESWDYYRLHVWFDNGQAYIPLGPWQLKLPHDWI